MHDCFGKPITPFCRVRAATAEELQTAGHTDLPITLSPQEQLAIPATMQSDLCNVNVVPGVSSFFHAPTNMTLEIRAEGTPQLCTARTLVRLD